MTEAGIDGGGVFKEFLTSLVLQAFNTNYGLFMNTSDQLLYPNPHRFAQERTQLKHYEFLGRILGKALYEGILIDAAFAGFFLSKCLGQVNYLDDLPSLDPELYRGLMFLKNYEGSFEDLSLYFTVDDQGSPLPPLFAITFYCSFLSPNINAPHCFFLFLPTNDRVGTDDHARVDTEWRKHDGDTGEQDSIYLLDGSLSTEHTD